MLVGSVPIYFGPLDMTGYTPTTDPSHSIIDIHDFENPEELARYLHYLIKHPDKYEQLLQWKKELPTQTFLQLRKKALSARAEKCSMCEAVNHYRATWKKKVWG